MQKQSESLFPEEAKELKIDPHGTMTSQMGSENQIRGIY